MRTRLLHRLATVVMTVILGGFLAATLVRYAPGFGVDERELDTRFTQETIRRLRKESGAAGQGIVSYYLHYVAKALRGDLGVSTGFGRPVAALIAERFPETVHSAGAGLACGWTAGMLLALAAVAIARPGFDFLTGAAAALPAVHPVCGLGICIRSRRENRDRIRRCNRDRARHSSARVPLCAIHSRQDGVRSACVHGARERHRARAAHLGSRAPAGGAFLICTPRRFCKRGIWRGHSGGSDL